MARHAPARSGGALAQPPDGLGIYLRRRSRSFRTPLRPAVRRRKDWRMTRPLGARAPRAYDAGLSPQMAEGRVIIEAVSPLIDCGETPIKRVVGDILEVEATIFSDGHQKI